jgi:hypothetical protein
MAALRAADLSYPRVVARADATSIAGATGIALREGKHLCRPWRKRPAPLAGAAFLLSSPMRPKLFERTPRIGNCSTMRTASNEPSSSRIFERRLLRRRRRRARGSRAPSPQHLIRLGVCDGVSSKQENQGLARERLYYGGQDRSVVRPEASPRELLDWVRAFAVGLALDSNGPPSCIVSMAVLGTMTIVAFCLFKPS